MNTILQLSTPISIVSPQTRNPSLHLQQESWAIAKMTARCALCMGALKIVGSPWLHPRLLYPKFFMGFCSDWAYKCACKIWSS